MPLPKKQRESRRRMTLRQRAEARAAELESRRREAAQLAGETLPHAAQLAEQLEQLLGADPAPPPGVYLVAAQAATQLAALLSGEHTRESHQHVMAAAHKLTENLELVRQYHESASFWELRTQIKEWVDVKTMQIVDTRAYGPYLYRRFLNPEGYHSIEYFGKIEDEDDPSTFPPGAPHIEDMHQTTSKRRIFLAK